MSLSPILLALVGDSAAGKSTLGAGIASLLGEERVTVVTTDDYLKHNRKTRRELRLSALHPDCNDLDLLGEHLDQLALGNPVVKAPYNHSTGDFDPPRTVQPSEFLIIEGLLGLHTESLRERYDVSVYLDTPEPLRHRWKVARDTAKRGYTAPQVIEMLERREAVSAKFIRPQRAHADMVVRFHPGSGYTDYEHLHATVTMRPTLDHPDLRAVIECCPLAASALKLEHDGDTEQLEIDGGISAEQATEVERELWSRRPELERLLMARTGNFTENGMTRHSHALAIAQLLLAYPVLRAKHTREHTG